MQAEKQGISDTDAAFLISVVGICNTLGRILSGKDIVICIMDVLLLRLNLIFTILEIKH